MKTFQEYLFENKKVYSFKVKVAGDIPENFETRLKDRLSRCNIVTFEKIKSSPVQKVSMDFPTLENIEVNTWSVIVEYPVTSPEIAKDIKEIGLNEEYFRVRGAGEPSEVDQLEALEEPTKKSVLQDSEYKDNDNVKHKEYFGDEYNKNFLKELAKAAKDRAKELGHAGNKKANVLANQQKVKQDKLGARSPVGSKK
jgi:hypothetical protein